MTLPTAPWRDLIADACNYAGDVPEDVLEAMVLVESNGDPDAVSDSNAIGLGQVIPKWHKNLIRQVQADFGPFRSYQASLLDPRVNLRVAARHLSWCHEACGTWETAVAKYHSGQCNPPPDFVDGQGTSTVHHLVKFLDALAQVQMDTLTDTLEDVLEAPTMTRPYIVIVAGHRSQGDGGNPTERSRTDELAVAYTAAFRSNGYRADWFQRDLDGDNLPTMTHGDLTTVCVGARDAIVAAPEELVIMLDLHYNGGHSVVHAIVPDNVGLRTGVAGGDLTWDTAANNTLDVQLATAIATSISDKTGLGLYSGKLKVPGVMSETETGVALDGRWRLGMFAATAGQRMKAARLVVEHAGWADAETLEAGFEATCAHAAVLAVNDVLGIQPPAQQPDEPDSVLTYPEGMDRGVATLLFGQATGDDGNIYGFNEHGPVSNLWLDEGKRTQRFPAITDVRHFDDRQYFLFAGGLVIWQPEPSAENRILAV